ncbi:MAG: YjbQ family protein, partial [Tissierellales bacterium]|nr:YjbQ family protein [Tissierellales bacterium]
MILKIDTSKREEFKDITNEIDEIVKNSGIDKGIVNVFVQHTTAGITINENADPDVVRDMLSTFDKIVPFEDNYKHYEGNSHAHIKASMLGSSVSIPIEEGKMILGTWQ